jgi:hypothetical protein
MKQRLRSTGWILWLGLLRIIWYSVPVLVLIFIVMLVRFLLQPPTWQYTLTADTEVAMIDLPDRRETEWRVDGAVLCVRDPLARVDWLSKLPASPCGRWNAYRVRADPEQAPTNELILRVGGRSGGDESATIHALLETQPSGGLMLALRADAKAETLGVLHLAGNDTEVQLPGRVNLVWVDDAGEGHARVLVFPFQGELTAGRDVTWSYNRMLNEGKLSVYTASDKSAAKRVLVQEMDLMRGDQVRLKKTVRAEDTVWPRGHLRYVVMKPGGDRDRALEVAGIGLAESLIIERFGSSEIAFRPGFWSRLMHDRLAIISGLMIGLLTILSGYIGSAGFFLGRESNCAPFRRLWRCLGETWGQPKPTQTRDDDNGTS